MTENEGPAQRRQRPGDRISPPRTPRRARPRISPRARRRRELQFRVSRVLSTSFYLWGANFARFTLLALVVYIPQIVWQFYLYERVFASEMFNPAEASSWTYFVVGMLLGNVLQAAVAATVIYGVFEQMRGRRASFIQEITSGLSRLPAVIAVSLLVGIATAIAFVPTVFLLPLGSGSEATACVMILFGLACPVLALWLAAVLCVAVPASVVERPGVFAAIARSVRLTKGFRLPLLGAMVLFYLIVGILGWALGGVLGALIAGGEAGWIAPLVASIVTASMQAVFSAVTYHDLRRAVEGIDTEELAAVFD